MKSLALVIFLLNAATDLRCAELQASPLQKEVQQRFDLAVTKATFATIDHFFYGDGSGKLTRTNLGEFTSEKEIRQLSTYIRFQFPDPKKTVKDGKESEALVFAGKIFGGFHFVVTLWKGDVELLSVPLHTGYGESIGVRCTAALDKELEGCLLPVDKDAFKPLYQELRARLKRANQPPEPTAPSGRGSS